MTLFFCILFAAGAGVISGFGFLIEQAWPLLFVSWVPLFLALRWSKEVFNPYAIYFLLGSIAGASYFFISLIWLHSISMIALLCLSFVLSLFYGTFALLAQPYLKKQWLPSGVIIALIWISLEWLRGLFFGWADLAYALVNNPIMIQSAKLGGVSLLTFCIVLSNVFMAKAIVFFVKKERKNACKNILVAPLSLLFLIAYGLYHNPEPFNGEKRLSVAVVQGDISVLDKWNPRAAQRISEQYIELSTLASKQNPDLIVWPETAIPILLDGTNKQGISLASLQKQVQRRWQAPLLFGVPEASSFETLPFQYWNAARLLTLDGKPHVPYRKQRLVPLGEYKPSFLSFLPMLLPGPEFSAGPKRGAFHLANARIAVLICFEDMFSESVAKESLTANILALISNDAWFGEIGARQHFNVAVLRAVETQRSVIRVGHNGPSALISPNGKIIKVVPKGKGFAVAKISLNETVSVYVRNIWLWPYAVLLILLIAIYYLWLDIRHYQFQKFNKIHNSSYC